MSVIVLKNGTMMENTTVYASKAELDRARELGINKGEIFRQALREAIRGCEPCE